MGASTGPIIAAGALSLTTSAIIAKRPVEEQMRIGVATGIVALGLGLFERVSPKVAVGLAWAALVTTMFVRVSPTVPTPIEAFEQWFNAKK